MNPNKDRCTGHCCEVIRFPLDMEGIRKALADTREGIRKWKDIETIEDMVVPLGKALNLSGEGQDFYNFACRHFDRENKLCKIYDKRPDMCRDFGESVPCDVVGCTWKKAKRDIEQLKEG